jgi:hypothetical protein
MEPTDKQIKEHMESTGLNFYNAREELREMEYKDEHPTNQAI